MPWGFFRPWRRDVERACILARRWPVRSCWCRAGRALRQKKLPATHATPEASFTSVLMLAQLAFVLFSAWLMCSRR